MQKFLKISSMFVLVFMFFTTTVSAQIIPKTTSSRLDNSFFAVWAGVVFCSVLFSFIINVICAYAIYNDATKNNIDSAILWAIFGFFLSWVGILIYFLAIKPNALNSRGTQISDKPVVTEIDTVSEPKKSTRKSKK